MRGETGKDDDAHCRPSDSLSWSADRLIPRLEVPTVTFADLECQPSPVMLVLFTGCLFTGCLFNRSSVAAI